MKVLIYARSLGKPTLTFLYNEISQLSQHISIRVLCQKYQNQTQFPLPNIREIPFEQNRLSRRWQWELKKRGIYMGYRSKAFSKALEAEIAEFEPDLVHVHFGPEAIRFWDNFSYRNKLPMVVSFHGYDASKLLQNPAYANRLKELSQEKGIHKIYVSQYMRQQLAQKGIDTNRSSILYYGTDCDFFEPVDEIPEQAPFVFLQVSSFGEKKGHLYTIEAFHQFVRQNPQAQVKMILAGDGPLREAMQKKSEELQLQSYLHFPGLINREQARTLMSEAHCFIHHSITPENGDKEGIPNAIMEAMAMELPVISTLHSGIPELVEHGVNGLLVAEKDTDAYADAMAQILDWPRKAINRQKVLTQFERRQHAHSLLDIYKEVLQVQPQSVS